jgi:hypothetical protein
LEHKDSGAKKKEVTVRHAEMPGQTINIDLCFVPATHQSAEILPTVSGSSGQIKPTTENNETWPGQVFAICLCSLNLMAGGFSEIPR